MGDVRVPQLLPHLPATPYKLPLRLSQKQRELESAGKEGLGHWQMLAAAVWVQDHHGWWGVSWPAAGPSATKQTFFFLFPWLEMPREAVLCCRCCVGTGEGLAWYRGLVLAPVWACLLFEHSHVQRMDLILRANQKRTVPGRLWSLLLLCIAGQFVPRCHSHSVHERCCLASQCNHPLRAWPQLTTLLPAQQRRIGESIQKTPGRLKHLQFPLGRCKSKY